ncbi:MAG: rhamnogalacturonan acetylesterase [Candidatus Solibacter sp.]|nr:rhamnogalacturonan acetylesterase [Candidatus Solibacter sp.]
MNRFAVHPLALILTAVASAQSIPTPLHSTPLASTQHPALFLVGDSIMKTGAGDGERGPRGMGYELVPMFDATKIHVYNEGLGGRSSRGYREEGAWASVLERLRPGDYVLIMFGHNDAANSQNYPNRKTLPGAGDETRETESSVTHKAETLHTYGWYLRQYAQDAKAKGATPILCSPVPRNTWIEGRIARGFDGYAAWAADAARMAGARFLDLNTLAANRYDALGSETAASYFNDVQHTTKTGARLNAEAVIEGLKTLRNLPLAKFIAAADQPALPALYVLGDSTAAEQTRVPTIQGWAVPFLSYFDPSKIRVVNAARGGRSSRTFITEGLLDSVVAKLHAGDIVLIQFGHNDVFPLNDNVARGSLHSIGEETEEIDNKVTGKHEVVHTYGWYLRKFVNDVRSKGARPIILTLTIRDRWGKDGKIERLPEPGLDLSNTNRFTAPSIYSVWAAEVARSMTVPLIDVHNMIADRYDREGPDVVSTYFNSPRDPTHRNPLGAEVDAAITLAGLKALLGPAFNVFLSDRGKVVEAADTKYIVR